MKDKFKTAHIIIMLVVTILLEIVCIVSYLAISSSPEETEQSDVTTSSRITYEYWMREPQTQPPEGNKDFLSQHKEMNFADRYSH